jgi:hypothetical protein
MSTEIHTIFPQIEAQSRSYPQGKVIECYYVVSKGTVILTDSDGEPLRDSWGEPYGDKVRDGLHHSVIASRLALKRHRTNSDSMEEFRRPIDYGPRRPGW